MGSWNGAYIAGIYTATSPTKWPASLLSENRTYYSAEVNYSSIKALRLVDQAGFEPTLYASWTCCLCQSWATDPSGRQGRTRTYVVSNVRDLQSRAFATQLHLTIKIKDILACVCSLKVISQQAMPPNQFHIPLVVITLIRKRCMVLYRGVLLCLN